jgi:hypothetical protein
MPRSSPYSCSGPCRLLLFVHIPVAGPNSAKKLSPRVGKWANSGRRKVSHEDLFPVRDMMFAMNLTKPWKKSSINLSKASHLYEIDSNGFNHRKLTHVRHVAIHTGRIIVS